MPLISLEMYGERRMFLGVKSPSQRAYAAWTTPIFVETSVEKPGEFHAVVYQAFSMPFLVSDRDLVMETKISRDPGGGVTVRSHSVIYPDAPETVGVRINLRFSNWQLIPVSKSQTRAVLEVHSNPGGYIPRWLTNYVQRFYVSNLFDRLRHVLRSGEGLPVSGLPPDVTGLMD